MSFGNTTLDYRVGAPIGEALGLHVPPECAPADRVRGPIHPVNGL